MTVPHRFRLTSLLFVILLAASPAFAANEVACEEVYQTCQQRLELHSRCADQHPADMVSDAAAIFELVHRLETSSSVGAFGPDPSASHHLETMLAGLRSTSDGSLSRPGQVESVLSGDLHHRHAERLTRLLEAPRTCEPSALTKLERSCRAGVGEVRALTRTGWPSHVATCLPATRTAPPVAP